MAELSITVPASHPQFASILALLAGSAAPAAHGGSPRAPGAARPSRRCRSIPAATMTIADRSTLPLRQSTRPVSRMMNAFTQRPKRRIAMERGASGAALTMRPLQRLKRNCALARRLPCRRSPRSLPRPYRRHPGARHAHSAGRRSGRTARPVAPPAMSVPEVPAAPPVAPPAPAAEGIDFHTFMQHLSGQMTKRDAAGAPLIHADYLASITAEISTAFAPHGVAPLTAITDIAANPTMVNYAVQLLQRDGRW
jgi:hypothetical protein